MSDNTLLRSIRSFVRRESRLSPSQVQAIERLWPQFGVDLAPINFQTLFQNNHPVILEIGFGDGESLLHQATHHPDNNFLGIEVHRPGVGVLLKNIEAQGIQNIRISKDDATDVLTHVPDNSLQGIQVFFPDPWHKKKHNKRRLIQPHFLDLVLPKLKQGGFVHCATDWDDYAEHMREVLSNDSRLKQGTPPKRITSKFERRGLKLGHTIHDFFFIKA